jgi:transglutaminase-like putative cysteine protease
MLIKVGYDLVFDIPAPTSVMFLLYLHPSRLPSVRQPEKFVIEPALRVHDFVDVFGNRCGFVHAPAGKLRFTSDAIVRDSGLPDPIQPDARQHPVEELPPDVLQFLLASRYCEVDKMQDIAWDLFGKLPPGWKKVQAVSDWVHNHVEFGYGYARPTKTAYDVYVEKQGVCRDFMHLTITLLRCLNIPARYATGYLGDIGVPPAPFPMDFSAWLEVYLGGQWWTFDARHNVPRIGRVLMARGRDAVDVALTTSFGPTTLEKFLVWTDEVKETPRPLLGHVLRAAAPQAAGS